MPSCTCPERKSFRIVNRGDHPRLLLPSLLIVTSTFIPFVLKSFSTESSYLIRLLPFDFPNVPAREGSRPDTNANELRVPHAMWCLSLIEDLPNSHSRHRPTVYLPNLQRPQYAHIRYTPAQLNLMLPKRRKDKMKMITIKKLHDIFQ